MTGPPSSALTAGRKLKESEIRVDSRAVCYRRESLGLSQTELARLVGISPSYASMIERGQRTSLSPRVAGKLAKALGIDIEVLRQPGPRLTRPRT